MSGVDENGPELLDPGVFEDFVIKYRARYGDKNFTNTMAGEFYNEACEVRDDHFQRVTSELLASQTWAFGWLEVIERVQVLSPSPKYQSLLERKWKQRGLEDSGASKTKALAQLMTSITDMVAENPKGWKNDFFEKMYQLFGGDGCAEIMAGIQNQFPEFKQWILDRVKSEKEL